MARGGKRTGAGGAKTNRTDLMSAGKPLPPKSAPDQTYGLRQQMEQAQRVMPMASQPALPAPPPAGMAAGQPGPAGPGPAGPMLPAPDPSQHILGPTNRPNEPVTAGIPSGPGPGPEAMTGFGRPGAPGNLSGMIAQAAQAAGSSALSYLANQAQAQGQ